VGGAWLGWGDFVWIDGGKEVGVPWWLESKGVSFGCSAEVLVYYLYLNLRVRRQLQLLHLQFNSALSLEELSRHVNKLHTLQYRAQHSGP